jgi:hypothetical protein
MSAGHGPMANKNSGRPACAERSRYLSSESRTTKQPRPTPGRLSRGPASGPSKTLAKLENLQTRNALCAKRVEPSLGYGYLSKVECGPGGAGVPASPSPPESGPARADSDSGGDRDSEAAWQIQLGLSLRVALANRVGPGLTGRPGGLRQTIDSGESLCDSSRRRGPGPARVGPGSGPAAGRAT